MALGLGLLAAACSSAEETTTSATEMTTTTTIVTTTTVATTTTTEPPTTTTEAPDSFFYLASLVTAGWEVREVEGEADEEVFHLLYDTLVRDKSNFEGEALEPAEALAAGELFCTTYEGFIDTFGIDESIINSNQSIEFVQSVYIRVRGTHAGFIGIAAAGGLCSRDVMRSTADFFLLLGDL
jgi:hypothetical protein